MFGQKWFSITMFEALLHDSHHSAPGASIILSCKCPECDGAAHHAPLWMEDISLSVLREAASQPLCLPHIFTVSDRKILPPLYPVLGLQSAFLPAIVTALTVGYHKSNWKLMQAKASINAPPKSPCCVIGNNGFVFGRASGHSHSALTS